MLGQTENPGLPLEISLVQRFLAVHRASSYLTPGLVIPTEHQVVAQVSPPANRWGKSISGR